MSENPSVFRWPLIGHLARCDLNCIQMFFLLFVTYFCICISVNFFDVAAL